MGKINLSKYFEVPDGLKPEEVRHLFEELLAMPRAESSNEALERAKAFLEVADRQWHTYQLLDLKTMVALDEWIVANWDPTSVQMTGYILGIIGSLGLTKSLNYFRRALDGDLSRGVRKEILGAIDEFGSHVDDPYFSLSNKNLKT